MKQLITFFLLSVLFSANSESQNKSVKDLFEYVYAIGETAKLSIPYSDDLIIWERSTDLISWDSIPGEHGNYLYYNVDTTVYIRGTITRGNCDPYISDTVFIDAGYAAVADFLADTILIHVGDTVYFTDYSLHDPDTWSWEFGDGIGSTDINPFHQYQYPGLYTVTLEVSNFYGDDIYAIDCYIAVEDTVSFIPNGPCPGTPTVTDADGNVYSTILMGDQCWMQENIKVTHYENGLGIPNVTGNSAWAALGDNNTDKGYCFYDNNANSEYGALYTWAAAMNGMSAGINNAGYIQGVCPQGWHIPGDEEWKELELFLGMSQSEADVFSWRGTTEGGKLKDKTSLHWLCSNMGATNSSGMTFLPGGLRYYSDGESENINISSSIWTSSEYSMNTAIYRSLRNSKSQIYRKDLYKSYGFSVRCIKDSAGTIYSLPTVHTGIVYNVTDSTAIAGGNVTNNGGLVVSAKGICWNTTGSPTILDNTTIAGVGPGEFESILTSFPTGATVYLKAYATNSLGTAYGNEFSFIAADTCGNPFTDIDGNLYNSVMIGNQCWMKENLKVKHYPNGHPIYGLYAYNDNLNLVETVGYLYKWSAIMNGSSSSSLNPSGIQGICPDGWHLPSRDEWTELTNHMGGPVIAGGPLKDTVLWISPNIGATNSSGFSALPSGYKSESGTYYSYGLQANWWSTTSQSISSLDGYFARRAYNNSTNLTEFGYYSGDNAFAVRCIKESEYVQTYIPTVETQSVSHITFGNAIAGGEVASSGGAIVTERGLCWNTTGSPDINDNLVDVGFGTGSFISYISGLPDDSSIYLRAWATNSNGTAYGQEVQFTTDIINSSLCVDSVVDIDGNVYNTTHIGYQCWMNENLKALHYPNGDSIPYIYSNWDWQSLDDIITNDGLVYYDHSLSNFNTFGVLYSYAAALGGNGISSNSNPSNLQGVCPDGWHLPSSLEWEQLELQLGMTHSETYEYGHRGTFQGSLLAGTAYLWQNDALEYNSFFGLTNFNAIPGGIRRFNGEFRYVNEEGSWWTSSDFNGYGFYRSINYIRSDIEIGYTGNYYGRSIRCVMDNPVTIASLPIVTTNQTTDITLSHAKVHGEVISTGGAMVYEKGFYWNTNGNPTLLDSVRICGVGIGGFSATINGLPPNTTYYVRAYAKNSAGISYGAIFQFTTNSSISVCGDSISDFDGNYYQTVQIGNQCWMQENIRSTHYANGIAIPHVESGWLYLYNNNTDDAFCYYHNSLIYFDLYGGLYTWAAAMGDNANSSDSNPSGVQGICPYGWHLPSDNEWKQLEIYLGMSQAEADLVEYRGTNEGSKIAGNAELWNDGNLEYNYSFELSGFLGLPAGRREDNAYFSNLTYQGFWWTSTEWGSISAWYRKLYYSTPKVYRNYIYKKSGLSVRCVKD